MSSLLVPQLAPSVATLSDQLELMNDDFDQAKLALTVPGKKPVPIGEQVVSVKPQRTIQGASTLIVTVQDPDLTLLQSGLFGGNDLSVTSGENTVLGQLFQFQQAVDLEIEGLWFRLVQVHSDYSTDRTFQLTFEDREVALLRSYPKAGDPHTYRVWSAQAMDRAQVMAWLVAEVKEVPIRLVCPMLTGNDKVITDASKAIGSEHTRAILHKPGLANAAGLTVKGAPMTGVQAQNTQEVLDVGYSMRAPVACLVAAVMTINTESKARNLFPSGPSIGIFQQERVVNGKRTSWPASGDIAKDAHAFFESAISHWVLDAGQMTLPALCQAVQASGAGAATDGQANYGPWEAEARKTVAAYLGTDDPHSPTSKALKNNPFAVPTGPVENLKGNFTRGSLKSVGGRSVAVREDNWKALQRLASEVGWRCYCVSGTVYIETDAHLFQAAIRARVKPDAEGIDAVALDIDTARSNAQVTLMVRPALWPAPPGGVVQLEETGPADGRWLVQTIVRQSMSLPQAEVTLTKPQPSLADAESAQPVLNISILEASGAGGASVGGVTVGAPIAAVRAAIVAAARKAVKNRATYQWFEEPRPMPASLGLGTITSPERIDCSTFVTLCYKAAGAPDPNGFNYNGYGNTGSLVQAGVKTATPQPGDLVFYGQNPDYPEHVALYTGDGNVVSLGGPGDPREISVLLGGVLPVLFTMDYLGGTA